MFPACQSQRAHHGRSGNRAEFRTIELDQEGLRPRGYPAAMADEFEQLREKLKRYRYLLTMITDQAVRRVLHEEVAALERRLAARGSKPAED